jgi:hypothetical protein
MQKGDNMKTQVYRPSVEDKNKQIRKRVGKLCKETGLKKHVLDRKIYTLGLDVMEKKSNMV